MPRVVVLGCGTGVGKTRLSVALLRDLARAGCSTIGLKPVESGLDVSVEAYPESDAYALASSSSLHVPIPDHPLYALSLPVSPHLAAREQGIEIFVDAIAGWVTANEARVTALVSSHRALWTVVETAGGTFSPLSAAATNFDLACALEPSVWILVAADSLGALHEVSATLQAMRARGRLPDHVVLSAAREPDASTGTNSDELRALGIATTTAVLERDDDRGIENLVRRLFDEEPSAP